MLTMIGYHDLWMGQDCELDCINGADDRDLHSSTSIRTASA